MSPISQAKNARLYRISSLIARKAESEGVKRSSIILELCKLLDVSRDHFYKIYRCRVGESGYLSVRQLTDIAAYFSCTIDELINKDLQSSEIVPGAGVSSPGAGTFSHEDKP